jgi:hypothetical protein
MHDHDRRPPQLSCRGSLGGPSRGPGWAVCSAATTGTWHGQPCSEGHHDCQPPQLLAVMQESVLLHEGCLLRHYVPKGGCSCVGLVRSCRWIQYIVSACQHKGQQGRSQPDCCEGMRCSGAAPVAVLCCLGAACLLLGCAAWHASWQVAVSGRKFPTRNLCFVCEPQWCRLCVWAAWTCKTVT